MNAMRAILAVIAIAAGGCQPHYEGAVIRYLSGAGDVRGHELEVVEAQAMVISVRPRSDNPFEEYEKFDLVDLRSANETIMLVAPADDVNKFVVVGAGLGEASIELLVNDREEDILNGTVVAQEVGP
jgi:hypothetical protein